MNSTATVARYMIIDCLEMFFTIPLLPTRLHCSYVHAARPIHVIRIVSRTIWSELDYDPSDSRGMCANCRMAMAVVLSPRSLGRFIWDDRLVVGAVSVTWSRARILRPSLDSAQSRTRSSSTIHIVCNRCRYHLRAFLSRECSLRITHLSEPTLDNAPAFIRPQLEGFLPVLGGNCSSATTPSAHQLL